jgi:membrane protein
MVRISTRHPSYPAAMASFTLPARLAPLRSPIDRIRAADPLLMSAAIAYNFFFAMVPLAVAAVAWLSTFGASDRIQDLERFLRDALPPDIAGYVVRLIQEAQGIVGTWEGPVIVLSLLIALYAGSRGVYAIQKAIRQIADVEETRPWWQVRGLGMLFTIGAGIALVGGYVIVLFGGVVIDLLGEAGLDVDLVRWFSAGVLALWLAFLLFAIYRWGPPHQVQRPMLAAVVATIIMIVMTLLAAWVAPAIGGTSTTLSTLGAVGVVLVWLYAIGFVVITVPALAGPAEAVIRGSGR